MRASVWACLALSAVSAMAETDMAGRSVELPPRIGRVISLLPSITETAFALGRGDRLVGRTSYCEQPPEALKLPVIGDIANPNMESILSLQPDLLLASDFGVNQSALDALTNLGLKIYFLDFRDYETSLESIQRMGRLLDATQEAEALLQAIRAAEAEVRRRARELPKPRVLVSIMHGPVWVAGQQTFLDTLLEAAGGVNAVARAGYGPMDTESILLAAPDVVLVGETESQMASAMEYWNSPELADIPARKSGRVLALPPQVTVPGPFMREAFWTVLRALHPEAAK